MKMMVADNKGITVSKSTSSECSHLSEHCVATILCRNIMTSSNKEILKWDFQLPIFLYIRFHFNAPQYLRFNKTKQTVKE